MERMATTPFGGAPLRAQIFALQAKVAKRQQALKSDETTTAGQSVDKWLLLRALTEARSAYGLSDRTIAVLEALVSFHGERQLDGSRPIIVFPSNGQLSLRARGMSPATLRRHLALLVTAGLIFRRDSPNGKRFCRKDEHGQVEDAYGFDLAPLALAAPDIQQAAETAKMEKRAIARLRTEISLHLRDISKTIQVALNEGRSGDWTRLAEALQTLSGRIKRETARPVLQTRRDSLLTLRAATEQAYHAALSSDEMSASVCQNEHHIQNTNIDRILELNGQALTTQDKQPTADAEIPQVSKSERAPSLTLETFTTLCPEIGNYARHGIRSWRDALEAADLVSTMLGISADAWRKARHVMGDMAATVMIGAILERAADIRSPGGYLRDLLRKAEGGHFTLEPMLNALKRPGKQRVSRSGTSDLDEIALNIAPSIKLKAYMQAQKEVC